MSRLAWFRMVTELIDRLKRFDRLFVFTVVIPTFLSIVYFGFVASDVYISESRFVVRSPEKPTSIGLGAILKSSGFSGASDEVHAVQSFASSRDALRALNKGDYIRTVYSDKDISIVDRYNSLGLSGTFEDLFDFFKKKITVSYDATTSMTELSVRAYSAEDAFKINAGLLELSEQLVNRLNERGRRDLIRFADVEVADAERRARQAALALSAYRDDEGVVDPEQQAALQLQLVSKLQDELISSRAQLRQLQAFTPENPQIDVLQSRIAGLQREIESETGKVAGNRSSLAGSAARYQRLILESRFADQLLASAMASLDQARNEARRKQVYLERVVQPSKPDKAVEPRRLRGILATLVLGLVAWAILTMVLAGVREHND